MPELPEVENIVKALQPKLKGKSFSSVEIRAQKSFLDDKNLILGKKIKAVGRRGKLIIIQLAGKLFLLIHLKMTGQLILQPASNNHKLKADVVGGHPDEAYKKQTGLPHKYTRVIFGISDGSRLYFNDLRLFGWVKIVSQKKLAYELRNIGRDALELTLQELRVLIQKYPRRKIKEFLQDQKLIAGIGNIYANEILFCAGILPDRRAGEIEAAEIKKLFLCIGRILKKAIKLGGTSFSDYKKPDGSRGGYLDQALVYQRAGERCRKCGGIIKQKKIGQRSAFYCPNCQK